MPSRQFNHKLIKEIIKKIKSYNITDYKKFGCVGTIKTMDVYNMIEAQNDRCWICNEKVLTEDWKYECLQQFSVDRIDNSLPHDVNNFHISCYYCNSRSYSTFKYRDGKCKEGCHQKSIYTPTKCDVIDICKMIYGVDKYRRYSPY